MQMLKERDIFIKAARCRDILNKSIETFSCYLEVSCAPDSAIYYQARNLLKEGEMFYEDVLKEAKKLLGPFPKYVPDEVKLSKAQLLADSKVVVEGRELHEIEAEIASDEIFDEWMSREEIGLYLKKNLEDQDQGQRKPANIKIRMILDKLDETREKARKLGNEARLKHQGASIVPGS